MLKLANATLDSLAYPIDPERRETWFQQRRAMESGQVKPAAGGFRRALRSRFMTIGKRIFGFGLRCTRLYDRGVANAEALVRTELEMYLDGLPRDFDGYRLVHLTDCHFDMNPGLTGRLKSIVTGETVDLCVLTGDLQDNKRSADCSFAAAEAVGDFIASFPQRDGAFAVLGNHDRADIVDPLEARGVRVLINESISVSRGGARIVLTGLDDVYRFATPMAYRALADAPVGFRIALVHSPDAASAAALHGHDLYLCGHTHGGQVCLPDGQPIVTGHDGERRHSSGRWACGRMAGYTNRGAGASMLPIRFNAPPEVAFITLRCFRDRLT